MIIKKNYHKPFVQLGPCASQITILHLNGPDQLTAPEVTEVQKVNPEVIAHADAMESNSNH